MSKTTSYAKGKPGKYASFLYVLVLCLAYPFNLSAASLSGTAATSPASVNLTTEGPADWVHWGRTTASAVDRKAGVTPQISSYTQVGGANPSPTSQVAARYRWNDGSPATSSTGSKRGLWVFGMNKGFQFTVPADTSPRTLKVYVGATAARGQLVASLSDGSTPAYTVLVDQSSGRSSRVITLDYQADSAGQLLTVNYTVDALYRTNNRSWITLESAALLGGGTGSTGGNNGSVALTPLTSVPGDTLTVTVSDIDLDTDAGSTQSVGVSVVNDVSGESEALTLTETGSNTGVFTGTVATAFGTATPGNTNIIPDPSFESGTASWRLGDNTSSIVSSPVRSGSNAVRMVCDGNGVNDGAGQHHVDQRRISGVTPGQEYVYTAWVKGNNIQGVDGGSTPLLLLNWRGSGRAWPTTWAGLGTFDWKQIKIYAQAPPGASQFDVVFHTWYNCTNGEVFWDDVSLTPRDLSSRGNLLSTYQAESANVQTGGAVSANEPDYTGTGYFDVSTNNAVLEWNNVTGGGNRVLSFRYSWEGNMRDIELFVNGVSQGTQRPLGTGWRGSWASLLWDVNLPAGNNTVRLRIGKIGGLKSQPMFDKLDVHAPQSGGGASAINNDGTLITQPGDTLSATYIDTLTDNGGSATLTASSVAIDGGGTSGNNGTISITPTSIPGEMLTIIVSDADLNNDAGTTQSIGVSVANDLTGESEMLTLVETGNDSDIFSGTLATTFGTTSGINNNGVLNTQAGDTVTATYDDALTSDGGTATVTATNSVISEGGTGTLSGVAATAPANTDLTSEGTADWIHWGRTTASAVDRKAGVTPQISSYTPVSGANPSPTSQVAARYRWNDGSPVASATGSKRGLWVFGMDKGFQLTVPADTNPRTLKIYVGATAARGQLVASLSDGSAPAYTTLVDQPSGRSSRVITLDYQAAAADQQLTVSYTVDALYRTNNRSWITLESAALLGVAANQPPILAPVNPQTVTEGQSLSVTLSASDADGPAPLILSETNTLPGSPSILTDSGGGTGQLNWTAAVGDAAGSPYSVTVTATDGSGATSSETFAIAVAANQAPLLSPIGPQTITEGQPLSVTLSASDADGPAPLMLSETNTLPGSPSILTDSGGGTGQLNWTAAVGDAASSPYSVTVTATDGNGAASNETIAVTVLPQGSSGALAGTQATASANTDLTNEGTADWIHWGRTTASAVDRKAGVTPQISSYTPVSGANPSPTSQVAARYRWNDGSPVASATGSKRGLWVFGMDKGFQFTVPADTNPRTLKVYVGATAARGQLVASLSDGSAPAYTTLVDQPSGRSSRVITLDYQAASAGQQLTVSYTVDALYRTNNRGWITLESAALQGSASEQMLPYVEDFSNGISGNWQFVNDSGSAPNWAVINQELHQQSFVGFNGSAMQNSYHRGTYAYLNSGDELSDYRFSVKAIPLADSGQDIGVMVRLDQNSGSYSRLSLSAANGFGRLETKAGGVFNTLQKNARGYQQGTPLNIVMDVQGPIVVAKVNGEKLFAAYDTSLNSGTVALYCRDKCAFDDVNITANSPTPTVVISKSPAYSVSPDTTFDVGAVVLNKPTAAGVEFQMAGLVNACTASSDLGNPGLFTATCTVPEQGVYQLTAILRDQAGTQLDTDTNTNIGVGNGYIAVGDSITAGLDDNTASDGISQNGWMISSQGYEAILSDLLNAPPSSAPSIVHNAGVPGDKSNNVKNDRLASLFERHPDEKNVIVTIGVNDATGTLFTPSGLGCSAAACNGTYKGNLQSIIDLISSAGKTAIISLVPPRFGDPFQTPYANPENHSRNLLIRDEYNAVITGELVNHSVGPDFYDYFLGSENRFYLYATNLHPNALGYRVMAHLLRNSITGDTALPFVVNNICLRLSQAGACVTPLPYKENLLETGNNYYVDQPFTLTNALPAALDDGRWIMTRDLDRDATNSDYLSMNIPQPSTLYIAYDAGAATLPTWLANNFSDTGLQLNTSNPSAPIMQVYRQDNVSGNLALPGADAAANGANANYIVIVVKN